jgi:hypothetical protein
MKRSSSRPFALALALALGAAASVGACSRSAPDEAPLEAPMPMVPPLPPPPTSNRDRPGDLPPAALVELGLKDAPVDAGVADAGPADAGVEAGAEGLSSTPFRAGRRGARTPPPPVGCEAPGGNESDCPLRAWMRDNAAKAILAKDFGALEQAFTSIAAMAPAEGFPNWASIAKDGAAATHVLHLDAVKATCRSCHQQYREKYKKERRATPLPNLAVR